jgi:hypothetical protein
MLCPYYYCLYSVFNKIRDKGRTISACKQGGKGREGGGEEGDLRVRGRNDPNIIYTYE